MISNIFLDRVTRNQFCVFSLLFVGYIGFYFCRVTLPVAIDELQAVFEYSKQQIGNIASYYFLIYATGKIVNGFLGARIAGKTMLIIGVLGSVICNFLFGFGKELFVFTILWSTNAFFQSMGWISLVSVMSQWFTPSQSGKAMGFMSLSYLMGDFIARWSAAFIRNTWHLNWSGIFWSHALIFALIGLVILLFLKPNPKHIGIYDFSNRGSVFPNVDKEKAEAIKWFKYLYKNLNFWLVCTVYFGISMIRYAFWIWSISYLKEECNLNLVDAVLMSTIIPVVGSVGAIVCGWISDKMNAMRGPVLVAMTGLLTMSLYFFVNIPPENHLLLMIALGLIGFMMSGPYSLIAGAMAIDFGSTRVAATTAGVMDAIGAIGAAIMGAGMGYVVDEYGWNESFFVLTMISLASFLLCMPLWDLKPTRTEDIDN